MIIRTENLFTLTGFFIKTTGKVTYKLPVYVYKCTRTGIFSIFFSMRRSNDLLITTRCCNEHRDVISYLKKPQSMTLKRKIKCALSFIKLSEHCRRAYRSQFSASFDLEGAVKSPKPVALSVESGFIPNPHSAGQGSSCIFLVCLAESSRSHIEKGDNAPCPATPALPIHTRRSKHKDPSHANGEQDLQISPMPHT